MAERKQQTSYSQTGHAKKEYAEHEYADPTQALSHYLDDLLQSATEAETTEPEVSANPVPRAQPVAVPPRISQQERENRRQRARENAERIRAKRLAIATAMPSVSPVAFSPEATPEEQPSPAVIDKASVAETTAEPVAAVQQKSAPETELTPEGRPQWAESAFECLLFRVAGLQLAVPLVLLGAIHRIEADIRELPGSPDWFMGILSTPQANLRVVNTAKWVMPGRAPESVESDYQFVIRLDDSEWALACDDVAQSFRLDPDAVRWRSERSRRPWLAGTVIDHMCALVDVRTMAGLLSRAEKEQHLDITG